MASEEQPIDPSRAQAAQIPLQTFTLPNFPPEANSLQALTLTADLKLDEYTNQLGEEWNIPPLPTSIEALTLELFSLGYPTGWLAALADRLPKLNSLVAYSQLLGGVSAESEDDAVAFFEKARGIRALHLLDVFARPGFFGRMAEFVTYGASGDGRKERKGVMFLEVNYTVQASDEDFLARVQAEELVRLIGPTLVSCAFNVAEAEEGGPEEEEKITEVGKEVKDSGIVAFNKSLGKSLVDALTADESRPRALRVLNSTLYTLTLDHLKTVLEAHEDLMVLVVTVEIDKIEESRKRLVEALELCPQIEQVEFVVNPGLQAFIAINNIRSNALEQALPSKLDLERLSVKCEQLTTFKASVLRSKTLGTADWEKRDGKWEGGVKAGKGAEQEV